MSTVVTRDYQVLEGERVPVFAWINGVDAEPQALEQAVSLTSLPFVFHHVALMPDVHAGVGSTIGSVIACKGAICPAAVGVDIGCGMTALRTSLLRNDLGDLAALRKRIEAVVPCGFGHGGPTGTWGGNPPEAVVSEWHALDNEYLDICESDPKLVHERALDQLGTLGSGNHFVEICLDDEQRVWIMLHSGSRGPGNKIGVYFTKLAQALCEKWFIKLPHRDLAYLPEDTDEFGRYIRALNWAQRYALSNRDLMLMHVGHSLIEHVGGDPLGPQADTPIRCHHNYMAVENHFGKNVMVVRKGAVRAREGDLCIIPGSMGARSYICEGLGNRDSFESCSHGAGRRMSRTKARATITQEVHVLATDGVECDKSMATVDESPSVYKDIDAVVAAEASLVRPKHIIKQVLCVKGLS